MQTLGPITQETDLKWQVLKIYDDGKIDLISNKPTSSSLVFLNTLGFNNGVYFLNDLCYTLYSNPDDGLFARSINLQDIEAGMNSNGLNVNKGSGTSKTYSGEYSYSPNIYDNVNTTSAGESASFYSSPTTAISSKKENLTVKSTYYYEAQQPDYYYDKEFYNLLFPVGSTYWIATRYVRHEMYYASFGIRYITSPFLITGQEICNSGGGGNSGNYAVRPIVSLPNTVELKLVSGTNEWQIVKK